MNILSVAEIREWDKFTISSKQITSDQLMEQAASACVNWIEENIPSEDFIIFCGKGNNGGDGLAIARLLKERGNNIVIYILSEDGSDDFSINLDRLERAGLKYEVVESFPAIKNTSVLIDAIFGSGLNRPADGLTKEWINGINKSGNEVISIDIPSGLFADKPSKDIPVIRAKYTLTFQSMKLAFLMAENEEFTGDVQVLEIGLDPEFLHTVASKYFLTDDGAASGIFKPRKKFAHKGNFGHALLLAGSRGKMGAAVLAAKAAVHSGSGLVTTYLPGAGNDIMQVSIPEVMCISDAHGEMITDIPEEIEKYNVVGVGPGIGKDARTVNMLRKLLEQYSKRIILDADALNMLGENGDLLSALPQDSILTPHPKEFERLFGKTDDEFARVELAANKAVGLRIIIVLKGHHTAVCLPDGTIHFNNNGNAGMAKGGSGDTLTGILTSLVGQKYSSQDAAILGVYLHGLAGDIAAEKHGVESMTPSNISECLGEAFSRLKHVK